jgi:hypothetical protein
MLLTWCVPVDDDDEEEEEARYSCTSSCGCNAELTALALP